MAASHNAAKNVPLRNCCTIISVSLSSYAAVTESLGGWQQINQEWSARMIRGVFSLIHYRQASRINTHAMMSTDGRRNASRRHVKQWPSLSSAKKRRDAQTDAFERHVLATCRVDMSSQLLCDHITKRQKSGTVTNPCMTMLPLLLLLIYSSASRRTFTR